MIFEAITIIGPGRMGLALGSALWRSGEVRTLTFFGRHPEPPSHPIFIEGGAEYVFGIQPLARDTSALILAVPDEIVPEMAFTVAAHGAAPHHCSAFHLSGALPTDVLGPLHEQGYGVGSLYPMVNVPDRSIGRDPLAGSFFAVTGASETVATARRLTAAIGAELITVPAVRRPLFYAVAVMAAGYLPLLLGLSARLMERSGVPIEEALPALLSIIRGVGNAVEARGLAEALPDPFVRGDLEAVALHLRALEQEDRRLYALLGLEVLRLTGDAVEPSARGALEELLGRQLELETTGPGF